MKTFLIISVSIILIGIAWYGLSPLFDTKVVNDPAPEKGATTEDALLVADDAAKNPRQETDVITPPSKRIPIVDTPAHPASGFVRIVKDGDQTIIRYEDYKTINGPDVRIYLANDLQAADYINLGPIKGTEGNINYTVPAGVDIARYRYVLTWCEDFSVLFNTADLSLGQ
ncbi:MAG: DM13 domain-containing protein [Candidatus Moraniibacteriota bacterium]